MGFNAVGIKVPKFQGVCKCVCVRLRGREGGIGRTAAESEGVCSDRPTTPLSVVVDVQWSQSTGE